MMTFPVPRQNIVNVVPSQKKTLQCQIQSYNLVFNERMRHEYILCCTQIRERNYMLCWVSY